MEAVSPSPETPMPRSLWFASSAPVASEGMRPCTPLKPCARFRKYAGVFEEQPMPENLATFSGLTFIS
jgi:hypothetical protein